MKVFYSPAYAGSGHAFDTTRKATWIADSLARSPISGVELLEPASLTRVQLARVHDESYIRAVETGVPRGLAESQGFPWDVELWPMVLSSNGGAVAGARAALEHGVAFRPLFDERREQMSRDIAHLVLLGASAPPFVASVEVAGDARVDVGRAAAIWTVGRPLIPDRLLAHCHRPCMTT